MKKIFLILTFTLLNYSNTFGQAAVDIPLIATDGTYPIALAVGLDLTATNCIDSLLGEGWSLIFPPPGIFEIRFNLAPYGCGPGPVFTYKDYRPPGDPPTFPFTGAIEHTLSYQTSSTSLDIDITYDLPEGTQMFITDQIGGTFLNLGPYTGQGIAIIPGTYTNIFSQALLIMEYNNFVPVELTSFTASVLQNEKVVELNWSTATETNNSGFEIQRTSPLPSPYQGEGGEGGRGWENIGFVPGFGTTTEPKSYSFIDEYVTTGIYKYRLKQIDFDGSFKYSNEIEVIVDFSPKEFVLYQNYPNPFNPSTTIKYEIPSNVILSKAKNLVTLKIYDVLGNEVTTLINEEKPAGTYEIEFSAADLPSGIYFYQLKAGNFIETKKMILAK